MWFRLIADYTKRELIFPSDKLVALSGISQLLLKAPGSVTRIHGSRKRKGQRFLDAYLAGIWQQRLPPVCYGKFRTGITRQPPIQGTLKNLPFFFLFFKVLRKF